MVYPHQGTCQCFWADPTPPPSDRYVEEEVVVVGSLLWPEQATLHASYGDTCQEEDESSDGGPRQDGEVLSHADGE